jgi:hypothetical protein
MPVPPMPARNTSPLVGGSTSGTAGGAEVDAVRRVSVRGARSGACTVTNDGQSPSRQE